ncbi:MAG: hypothetical protein LKJ60_05490 [Lentilactobacillus buchneri]|jgi:hypothetical protein|nr:hypothetical protein [Lentilactobacillus buchneri]
MIKLAKGPYGMGAVGAISAAIGGAVGWAVNKGMKSVDAGIHIHGAHASYTVHIPK